MATTKSTIGPAFWPGLTQTNSIWNTISTYDSRPNRREALIFALKDAIVAKHNVSGEIGLFVVCTEYEYGIGTHTTVYTNYITGDNIHSIDFLKDYTVLGSGHNMVEIMCGENK